MSYIKQHRLLILWVVLIFYAGLILLLSLSPMKIHFLGATPYLDKIIHAVEYGIFSILVYSALRGSFRKLTRLSVSAIALFTSALYGGFTEYTQSLVPFRQAEVWDLVADITGAGIAQAVILIIALRHSS